VFVLEILKTNLVKVKEIGARIVSMTEYVKVLTAELKSVQSINKILSKEINQIVKAHKTTENLHTIEKCIYRSKNHVDSESET
jgi:hypothetical protein